MAAPELLPLVSEKIARDALYDQALALCNETDEELKAALGDRQAVVVGSSKVYCRPQPGKTLYKGKELLAAYRALIAWTVEMRSEVFEWCSDEPVPPPLPPPESFIDHAKPSRPLRLFAGRKYHG